MQLAGAPDEHMVDVTSMEPTGQGDSAIQVLLAASTAAHGDPAGDVLPPDGTAAYNPAFAEVQDAVLVLGKCHRWLAV